MTSPVPYRRGDRVVGAHATYEIVSPASFAGLLPTAKIVDGSNVGVTVILTTATKQGAPEEGAS